MSSKLLTITAPSVDGVEIINMDFYKSPNVLLNLFCRNATQDIKSNPLILYIYVVVTKNSPVLLSIYFLIALMLLKLKNT